MQAITRSGTLEVRALEAALGAVLLLDPELRIGAATPSAVRLLGEIPPDAAAADVLCGSGVKRPVLESLVVGRATDAVVAHRLSAGGDLRLRVRATPLPGGWMLVLTDLGATDLGPAAAVEFEGMWTQDARMLECFRIVERVAPEDDTVLVRGETGAGKELVAKALHSRSLRRDRPFRAINCAALPASLLESELFGHTRGAFTGAHRDVPGHVRAANGGTLFLDEIAELPLELQAKLLRVIETHSVIPVGGRDPIPVDVRFVAATHRSLRQEVEAGRFRADLMYRVRVIPIFLPPLRERKGDISLLCERTVGRMNERRRRRIDRISPAAVAALERYDWPGNIRELLNVLVYAYTMGDGPELSVADLPPEVLEVARGVSPSPVGHRPSGHPDDADLLAVIRASGGNHSEAARRLGVSRVTVWRRLKELGKGLTTPGTP